MKIAILVAGFPPRWLAGTEIATYNIAKYLAKLGHEVHVVTSLDRGLAKESTEQGFFIHRVPAMRRMSLFTLTFIIPAFTAVRRIKPDIIHTQSIPLGLCALLDKKILKKPFVVYGRGNDIYMSWPFKAVISKLVLRNADAMIALTNDMSRALSRINNSHVYVIPNGVELERFNNLSRQKARQELNIAEEDKVAIFIGRFRPEKNVACLIEAMEIMVRQNAKIKLLIVGEGEEEHQLKEQTKRLNLDRQVYFVGQVAYHKVPGFLAAADVFVLPSLSEGFPVVIPEAMASGLPVIATNVRGISEIITDGENGFLVEPGNAKQIAEAVLRILGNEQLAKKISASNKIKANQYSWHATALRLEEVYRKITKIS